MKRNKMTIRTTRKLFDWFSPAFFVSCMLWLLSTNVHAELTTPFIITKTLAAMPQCLHYQVIGICFWQNSKGAITSTLKVKHYIPDLVVSVFNHAPNKEGSGVNAWSEIRALYDIPAYSAGNAQNKAVTGFSLGGGQTSRGDQHNNDTHLKEVDVIGNPIVNSVFGNATFLPSQANPYFPYYESLLDAMAWRYPLLEMILEPQGDVPGLHEIGKWPLSSWGPVYPRTGFSAHPNDAKDAAITAFRASHIVTRIGQPHLYKPISADPTSCGAGCVTQSVVENDDRTQWQMLSPLTSNTCEMFGQNDSTQLREWGSQAAMLSGGAYVFNLWRLYQGCIPGAGNYIGSINF